MIQVNYPFPREVEGKVRERCIIFEPVSSTDVSPTHPISYNTPEHTPSSHSTSLLTVVKFSYPLSVMVITSSILTPPTLSYLARTS